MLNGPEIKIYFNRRPLSFKIKEGDNGLNAIIASIDDRTHDDRIIGTQITEINEFDCINAPFDQITSRLQNSRLPLQIVFQRPPRLKWISNGQCLGIDDAEALKEELVEFLATQKGYLPFDEAKGIMHTIISYVSEMKLNSNLVEKVWFRKRGSNAQGPRDAVLDRAIRKNKRNSVDPHNLSRLSETEAIRLCKAFVKKGNLKRTAPYIVKDVFYMLDTNNDGFLDRSEITVAMKAMWLMYRDNVGLMELVGC